MGWVSAALLLIKSIPDLIKVVKEIIAFVKESADNVERGQKMKELKGAIEESRKTGDTKRLENLFGKSNPN